MVADEVLSIKLQRATVGLTPPKTPNASMRKNSTPPDTSGVIIGFLCQKLVAAESPGERVLRPNDLTSNLKPRSFERVLELALVRRPMADIQGGAGFQSRPGCPKRAVTIIPESHLGE
jgi:hypothetical protein